MNLNELAILKRIKKFFIPFFQEGTFQSERKDCLFRILMSCLGHRGQCDEHFSHRSMIRNEFEGKQEISQLVDMYGEWMGDNSHSITEQILVKTVITSDL